MLPKPNVDASRLLSAEAKRSPEMEALWQWMLAEDSGLPNPETLPLNEQRALVSKLNERWNADLPPLAETLRIEVPGPSGPIACEWMAPEGARPGAILFIHGGGWAV